MRAARDTERLKIPKDAQEMFDRAEAARDEGRLEDAARLFGRSAATWAAGGRVIQAADAYFELGAILLFQRREGLLPDLADRLLELLKSKPLPSGSRLKLRVFALLMRKSAAEPGAFLSLVYEQRRNRKARLGQREAGAPWTPAPNEKYLERRFAMATRRESIVLAGRLEVEARAFDCPIRCMIGDAQVIAWVPATEAGREFAWMLEAKSVALMEEYPSD